MLQFAINAYTDELKATGRKKVPTYGELAKLLKVTPTSFSRMASNKVGGPSRVQIEAIILEFRRRGFETEPNDLLRWIDGPITYPGAVDMRFAMGHGPNKPPVEPEA